MFLWIGHTWLDNKISQNIYLRWEEYNYVIAKEKVF